MVSEAVRTLLSFYVPLDPQDYVTTTQLVDALYPLQHARGDIGIAARKRLFKCAMTLAATDLSDCATKGDKLVKGMYGSHYPWYWHAPRPRPKKVCPHWCDGMCSVDGELP
jgi:hypothetical protein